MTSASRTCATETHHWKGIQNEHKHGFFRLPHSLHIVFQGVVDEEKTSPSPQKSPQPSCRKAHPEEPKQTHAFLSSAYMTTHPSLPVDLSATLAPSSCAANKVFPTTAAKCIGKDRADQFTGTPRHQARLLSSS